MRSVQSLGLRMVRPGRRASDILPQVPAFDAAGWTAPRHVVGGPDAQQGGREGKSPLAGKGPITREVAQKIHRFADEQSRIAFSAKGRGRTMHQEVRDRLGGN